MLYYCREPNLNKERSLINNGEYTYRKISWVMLASDVGNAPERLLLLNLLYEVQKIHVK